MKINKFKKENINPVIIFFNSLTDYIEKYEVKIGLEEFQENYTDNFTTFIETKLIEYDCNEFDVDGWVPSGCYMKGNEYTIQIDGDEPDWKENLNKVIQIVIEYFEKQGVDLNKIKFFL